MGINAEAAEFLCEANDAGISFRRVLTLGRLNLSADRSTVRALAARRALDRVAAEDAIQDYAEAFFRIFLGAERVDSVDHSNYEGASLVHDMNQPIPPHWEQQYDAVVDGGCLEHIFNFPVALASSMRMVSPGGRLFLFAPANNQLGHGFYQFSPELFFRTLAPAHGFEVEDMLAVQYRFAGTEYGSLERAYRVADPASVGSRITLVNSRPVTLMIRARKTEHRTSPFETFPQQSDYGQIWKAAEDERELPTGSTRTPAMLREPARLVKKLLPGVVGRRLRDEYDRHFVHSFRNKSFYRPAKV